MSVDLPGYIVLFVFVHFKERLFGARALADITAASEHDTIAADGRRVLPVLGVVKQLYCAHSIYLLIEFRLKSPARSEHSLIAGLEVLGLRAANTRNKPKEFLVCHSSGFISVVFLTPTYPAIPITLVSRRNLMPHEVLPRSVSGSSDIRITWPR